MMGTLLTLAAVLLYPGLLFLLALALGYAALAGGAAWRSQFAALLGGALTLRGWNRERAASILSVLPAAFGMALLPWPWHPLGISANSVLWLWVWLAFELAFLLPLLPPLLCGKPLVVHTAMRVVQMGVLGRTLLWLALGAGLVLHQQWALIGADGQSPLLAHLLALGLAGIVFPLAATWGPYRSATGLLPTGPAHGLAERTVATTHAAHAVQVAALLAASLLALLPVTLVEPLFGLLMVLGAFLVLGALLQRLADAVPRPTLTTAVQRCVWRAVPLSIAVVVYLSLVAHP